jgi:hypothetical protein
MTMTIVLFFFRVNKSICNNFNNNTLGDEFKIKEININECVYPVNIYKKQKYNKEIKIFSKKNDSFK